MVLRHSVQTTRNALSAIRRENLKIGNELPTPTAYFPLKEALRGAERYLSRPIVQKHPITPSILMVLIGSTNWGSPMRCLYLTLWFTFARLASLIPTDPSLGFSARDHLTWKSISFQQDSVRIVLNKTKTIQCNERYLEFSIPKHRNPSICLFTQLRHLYSVTPKRSPSDPVFIDSHSGLSQQLTRDIANPIFKSSLAAAGLNPANFGWPSFRRGGATTAFIATGDVEALREHGDWKSNAYTRYLALPANRRTHLVNSLQNVLH